MESEGEKSGDSKITRDREQGEGEGEGEQERARERARERERITRTEVKRRLSKRGTLGEFRHEEEVRRLWVETLKCITGTLY